MAEWLEHSHTYATVRDLFLVFKGFVLHVAPAGLAGGG